MARKRTIRMGKECVDSNIPAMITVLSTPFALFGTYVLVGWLVLNGFLSWSSGISWPLVSIWLGGLTIIQISLYKRLLLPRGKGKRKMCVISGPGCLAGSVIYLLSFLICVLVFWKYGLGVGSLAVILTPMLCLGASFLFTQHLRK
jgi:hypothetical protein